MRVFVTGATGRQGGATAALLLARGHQVVALTSNPQSKRASALARSGARVVTGEMADRDAMARLMRAADAVFAVPLPAANLFDDTEARRGVALAEAAQQSGVAHLVFASATFSPTTRFANKLIVEQRLRGLEIPTTVVAPAYFMENIFSRYHLDGLLRDRYVMAVRPQAVIHYIAAQDIADFVVHVLESPSELAGKRVQIAGDALTGPGVADVLSEAIGRQISFEQRELSEFERSIGYPVCSGETGLEHWNANNFGIDLAFLRTCYPNIGWHSFLDWARQQDWEEIIASARGRHG